MLGSNRLRRVCQGGAMTIDIRCIALGLVLFALAAHAEDDLQNRGHDPFFQISSGVANCPEPAGPRISSCKKASRSCPKAAVCSRA